MFSAVPAKNRIFPEELGQDWIMQSLDRIVRREREMIFEEERISSGQIRAINQIRKEGRTSSNVRERDFKLGGCNF